ncbi:MAG TPA: LysR family transcriptional regulator [Verrucomicrobiae bacterium]|jgi:DNA-binding transcriptional LysR family regulator
MVSLNDIDLDLMRTFLTVLESGGFTQASKRLGVTQSGITLKIQRLEQQLNCRLFKRTTKPLELSPEGEVVLGYGRRLLDLSQEMTERVATPKSTGAVRIGVLDHFGPELLPVWLANFKSSFPEIKVESDVGATQDLLVDLEEDKFDLVIASSGYTAMSEYKIASAIQETHLQKEQMLWVQAANSKIDLKKDPLPLALFSTKCRFRPMALAALQKAGRAYDIVFVGGSLNSIHTAVRADLGLSVLTPLSLAPDMVVLGDDSGLPKLPPADLSIYSRRKSAHPMIPRLTSFFSEAVRKWEATQPDLKITKTTDAVRLTAKAKKKTLQPKVRLTS